MASSAVAPLQSPPPDEPRRKDAIASIAGQIAVLSTGDRAALRRIYLTSRHSADGVVIGLLHRAGVTTRLTPQTIRPWRLVAHVSALLSGTGGGQSHAPARRLGTVLHTTGFSENRLLRLTAARDQGVYDQIIRAARMMAQAGEASVNLWAVYDLVCDDPVRAEDARIRIAQDYYAAAARSAGDSK